MSGSAFPSRAMGTSLAHAQPARALDPLYDTTYTVPGPRDHYREQSRAAGFQLERRPDYPNYFSELPHFPSQMLNFQSTNIVPTFVDRQFQASMATPLALHAKSNMANITGANRYKYFRRAPVTGPPPGYFKTSAAPATPAGSGVGSTLGGDGIGGDTAASYDTMRVTHEVAPGGKVTSGTQSDFRESEAQTVPYQPEYHVPEPNAKQRALMRKYHLDRPELLTLTHLTYGHGLPAGVAEVEIIEKQRHKRAFEASLPPLSDLAQLGVRLAKVEQWEKAEWEEREGQIKHLQDERLQVLERAIRRREDEAEGAAAARLAALREAKLADKQAAFADIQKRRIKALRKLAEARRYVGMEPPQAGEVLVEAYARYSSTVYAPLSREAHVVDRPSLLPDLPPEAFEPATLREVLDLEATVPLSATTARIQRPDPHAKPTCAAERQAAAVQAQVAHIDTLLQTSKKIGGRGYGDAWPAPMVQGEVAVTRHKRRLLRPERPTTAAVPSDEESSARAAAIVLLQRLLRGRAAQNRMFEGKQKRQELIAELRLADEQQAAGGAAAPAEAIGAPPVSPAAALVLQAAQGAIIAEILTILAMSDPVKQATQLIGLEEDRRKAAAQQEALEMEEAALKLQAGARGMMARKKAAAKKAGPSASGPISLGPAPSAGQDLAGELMEVDEEVELLVSGVVLDLGEGEEATEAKSRVQEVQRSRKARREVAAMEARGHGLLAQMAAAAAEAPPAGSAHAAPRAPAPASSLLADANPSMEEAIVLKASAAGTRLEDEDMAAQVTKIQAGLRGRRDRKKVAALRAERAAALDAFREADLAAVADLPAKLATDEDEDEAEEDEQAAPSLTLEEEQAEIDAAVKRTEVKQRKEERRLELLAAGQDTGSSVRDPPPAPPPPPELSEEELLAQATAAAKIQKMARGRQARKDVAEAKRMGKLPGQAREASRAASAETPEEAAAKVAAAQKIQSRARGMKARKEVTAIKATKTAVKAHGDEETIDVVEAAEADAVEDAAAEAAEEVAAAAVAAASGDEEALAAAAQKIQARARGVAARKATAAAKDAGTLPGQNRAAAAAAPVAEAEVAPAAEVAAEEAPATSGAEDAAATPAASAEDVELAAAAQKIQARARGIAARKDVAALKETGMLPGQGRAKIELPTTAAEEAAEYDAEYEAAKAAAAQKIQARARGMAARKEVAALKAEGLLPGQARLAEAS